MHKERGKRPGQMGPTLRPVHADPGEHPSRHIQLPRIDSQVAHQPMPTRREPVIAVVDHLQRVDGEQPVA